ncbi:MAG: ferredoxin family protein [Omnitrophica WOR_2 bacterium]
MDAKIDPTKENEPRANEDIPHVYIDDILISLKYYVDEHEPHLQIIDGEVCTRCEKKTCLYFCPAGAYQEQDSGQVLIAYQSCIECGSCRVMCPSKNIQWKYPRGGYGVAYKFG